MYCCLRQNDIGVTVFKDNLTRNKHWYFF